MKKKMHDNYRSVVKKQSFSRRDINKSFCRFKAHGVLKKPTKRFFNIFSKKSVVFYDDFSNNFCDFFSNMLYGNLT